jgi:hypothetical protein
MASRWWRKGRIDANQIGVAARRTGSPGGMRTHERQAPIRQAIARARVREFGPGSASSGLDASLRLAAQEDHEIRAFAGLRAQRLVRDDQGRSRRRHPGNTIQWLLRSCRGSKKFFYEVQFNGVGGLLGYISFTHWALQ